MESEILVLKDIIETNKKNYIKKIKEKEEYCDNVKEE